MAAFDGITLTSMSKSGSSRSRPDIGATREATAHGLAEREKPMTPAPNGRTLLRNLAADGAIAQDTNRRAIERTERGIQGAAVPQPGDSASLELRQAADQAQHQRDGVFGDDGRPDLAGVANRGALRNAQKLSAFISRGKKLNQTKA